MSLISPLDRQLLQQHHVEIDIDAKTQCGIITFDNRRLTVSLLTRKIGNDNHWKPMDLEEEQMKETAGKVAVMLLKKELLQSKAPEPLNFKINYAGIAFPAKYQFVKHDDSVHKDHDTRKDYEGLRSYVNSFIREEVPFSDDVYDVEPPSPKAQKEPSVEKKSSVEEDEFFDFDEDSQDLVSSETLSSKVSERMKVQQQVLDILTPKKERQKENIALHLQDLTASPQVEWKRKRARKVPLEQTQSSPPPVADKEEKEGTHMQPQQPSHVPPKKEDDASDVQQEESKPSLFSRIFYGFTNFLEAME